MQHQTTKTQISSHIKHDGKYSKTVSPIAKILREQLFLLPHIVAVDILAENPTYFEADDEGMLDLPAFQKCFHML